MELLDQCRRAVFKELWRHYYQLVPFAPKIEQALAARQDLWVEDHVAFRTLPGPHCGAHILEGMFAALGYERQDNYHFEEKRLDAFWMAPPDVTGTMSEASPKIFISELIPTKFSTEFQQVLTRYSGTLQGSPLAEVNRLSAAVRTGDQQAAEQLVTLMSSYLTSAPPWPRPAYADFDVLQRESEYASWTLLYGNQINHFTVSVHLMKSFPTIADLGSFIEKDLQIPMNHSGGMVKGSSELLLEQIATMAVKRPYLFQDRVVDQSYGFVEFALRYPLKDGEAGDNWKAYYQGFVTSNADKIFESTYRS